MRDECLDALLTAQGLEIVGSTPKEFAQVMVLDRDRWGAANKAAGVKAD